MDQLLLIMASVMGEFLQFVGGPEYAYILTALLERLCCSEDAAVRSTAATSTCKILSLLNTKHTTSIQSYFELYQRLSNEDGEVFYGRMSACQITADIYRLVSASDRAIVIELYGKLVNDELSMVRRGAGLIFLKLVEKIESDFPIQDVVNLMKTMTNDEHSSVRSLAFENIGPFTAQMKRLNAQNAVMIDLSKIIKTAVDDSSWKIRQVLAKSCSIFPSCFPPAILSTEVFPGVITLLQDAEPDVRISALEGIVPYVQAVGPANFLFEFSANLAHLVDDPIPGVRKALCDACVDIAATILSDDAQQIHEAILKLILDEDPLVRLRILKKIHILATEIPLVCMKLTDSLKKMFKDNNWRVRKQIGSVMPSVVKHLGSDYFCDNFLADFLLLLNDGVDEVREEISKTLPELVTAATAIWVYDKIFPTVRDLVKQNFLIRICFLSAFQGLLLLELPESFSTEIIESLSKYVHDKVPNIRIRTAQVLGYVIIHGKSDEINTKIRPLLQELSNDKDKDVKYFAEKALKSR